MPDKYLVNQCICHKRSFSEIKDIAEVNSLTSIEDLQRMDVCSTNCKLCKPYIEMMLETGSTEFTPGAYLKKELQ